MVIVGPRGRSLFYFSVSGTTASSLPNSSFTYGGKTFKTDDSARVYCTAGETYVSFGDYSVHFVGINPSSTQAKDMIILKRCEWVGPSTNWKYYDFWGLTNTNITNRDNGFLLSEVPRGFFDIYVNEDNLAEYQKNNVSVSSEDIRNFIESKTEFVSVDDLPSIEDSVREANEANNNALSFAG